MTISSARLVWHDAEAKRDRSQKLRRSFDAPKAKIRGKDGRGRLDRGCAAGLSDESRKQGHPQMLDAVEASDGSTSAGDAFIVVI